MNKELIELTKKYQQEFNLDYNSLSIFKLNRMMKFFIDSNIEIKKELRLVWGTYFGECLNYLFEGHWTELDQIELNDGRIIDPFEIIDDFINHKKSVYVFFHKLKSEYDKSIKKGVNYSDSMDEQISNKNISVDNNVNKKVKVHPEIVGLSGFSRIESAEDILYIEELKERARKKLEFLEKIDSSIKSYDEYELLHKCSVTSVEFKEIMEKLEYKVAINGDGKIMYELSKEYYEFFRLEEIEEFLFWVFAAARKGVDDAISLMKYVKKQ